jgi:ferrous-iron efflux pump FieF
MMTEQAAKTGPTANPAANPSADDSARWRRRATYASVAVAVILITAKLATYLVTGSVSILSSLIDSSVDLLASVVTLIGVARALQPASTHYRFGYGKAESLAALAQAAFITGSSIVLAYEAMARLVDPRPLSQSHVGIAVMVFSILVTLALVSFQRWVTRRTGSVAIDADRLHYSGDLYMNLAVIAALLLGQWTGSSLWDPGFALAISVMLLLGARQVAGRALGVLMDQELPDTDRVRVKQIVLAHPQARGLHDLRTRSTGLGLHIEFHLELDSQLTLAVAHDITDAIEQSLKQAFPTAEFAIHQEPAGLDDERLDHRIRRDR